MRALLLEDDPRLGPLVARGLRQAGHAVDLTTTIGDARWLATENAYDALVLDIALPDGDGLELCAELRASANWTPALMLTARDGVADRVRGLDVGADDYLVKPFDFEELLARLRAIGRRGPVPRPTVIEVGALRLDPASRQVTVRGEPVGMAAREFSLLELLARRADEVLNRSTILEHVWDWAYDGGSNVIDVHIHGLRAKLGAFREAPSIETVRGIGYVLRRPPPST